MAEEHRFQAQRLCANNCGFFGSPATQDLCSKCYRHLQMEQQQSSNVKMALNQTLASSSSSPSPSIAPAPPSEDSPSIAAPPSDSIICPSPSPCPSPARACGKAAATAAFAPAPNRCSTCRRRVGLTGFKCRCGLTYCGTHRYPEQHACGFDFKAMGREQLSKANPLVIAPKLDKI